MSFEHPSGLPAAYDRGASAPNRARVVWPEGVFVQGADLNEAQTLEARRNKRVGNMVARDGDRVSGADITVNRDAQSVSLANGRIYVNGDVRSVSAAVLTGIPMTGEVQIGVKLQYSLVTHEDDPSLLGLHPGTYAEGEPGAAREHEMIVWATEDDGQEGDFYSVYLVRDGTVIDQTPPPALTGIMQSLALYDRDANGHYIVDGCEVKALGKVGADQVFSIEAGTANIMGWKRIREFAMRHAEPEVPDLEFVTAETHTFTGATGASTTVNVSRPPINSVSQAIVVKRVTETVTRGPVPNTPDALQFSSITEIEAVTQGGTTFATGTYALSGDQISWAPAGAEPAAGSTYTVTYLYNALVTPDDVTATSVTVSGGVNGKPILLSYSSKIPRKDLLCLDITGRPVYIKGVSARINPRPPIAPTTLLKLAVIDNTWFDRPTVNNDGTRNYTYAAMKRYFDRVVTMLEQFDRSEAERDILSREPVSKKGIFTDNFVDDFYRDQGAEQTAAVNQGVLQLAIDPIVIDRVGGGIHTLDWSEEIVIRQDVATSGMKINPYMNFNAMPAGLKLEPPTDFWTDHETQWTSEVTQEFTAAPGQPPGRTSLNEVLATDQRAAQTLRQITVSFRLEGFGVGENLEALTFDGVDVKPPGTQTANSDGIIEGSFTIPAGIPVGTRAVRATGAAGSFARALFVGEGTIDIVTMRRVNLVTREAPPPVIVQQTIIQQVSNPVANWGGDNSGNGGGDNGPDPLAQTFTLPEPRHIVGVNFKFTEIGDRSNGVRVQLCTVLNGYPTNEILAEAFINMQTPQVGDLVQARFDAPVFLSSDREFAFVIMTDDADHAVAISQLGDVQTDPVTGAQTRVGAQPYTVGVMLSSANRLTWTPHQDADICFQIVAAQFSNATKVVDLWTGNFPDISDLVIRGAVEIATADARFRYELVRASGQVIAIAPGQNVEFSEFISEQVTLRAVLEGSSTVSPILYPGTVFVAGRIRSSGTYITRVFEMGASVRVAALFASRLPPGSSAVVEIDAVDDNWQPLPAAGSTVLGGGWNEPRFEAPSFTAHEGGRVRITLNGSPGARPSIARLRAYSL